MWLCCYCCCCCRNGYVSCWKLDAIPHRKLNHFYVTKFLLFRSWINRNSRPWSPNDREILTGDLFTFIKTWFGSMKLWCEICNHVICVLSKRLLMLAASVHTQSHSVFAGQWHEFIELLLFILAAAHDVWLLIAQTANIKTIKLWIYGQKLWKEMPVIFGLNFISAFFFSFVFSTGVSLSVVTLTTR